MECCEVCGVASSELERRMAHITGKEAALFVPSGTMGNLISCEIFNRFFWLFTILYFSAWSGKEIHYKGTWHCCEILIASSGQQILCVICELCHPMCCSVGTLWTPWLRSAAWRLGSHLPVWAGWHGSGQSLIPLNHFVFKLLSSDFHFW